jgi:hypothetical protein
MIRGAADRGQVRRAALFFANERLGGSPNENDWGKENPLAIPGGFQWAGSECRSSGLPNASPHQRAEA